jgi:hypothetical protein
VLRCAFHYGSARAYGEPPADAGGLLSEGFPAPGGFRPGSLVAGYRIESRIGAGGMAVVFRARDEHLGRLVALKVMAPQWTGDEGFRRRFVSESRAAAAVDEAQPMLLSGKSCGPGSRSTGTPAPKTTSNWTRSSPPEPQRRSPAPGNRGTAHLALGGRGQLRRARRPRERSPSRDRRAADGPKPAATARMRRRPLARRCALTPRTSGI